MTPTCAVDNVDSVRVFQVLNVFVKLEGGVVGKSSKGCLLPETSHQIQGMLQRIAAAFIVCVTGLSLG